MKWQTKALLQKIISALPYSGKLNYFLQTKVTKNLPMSDEVLEQKKQAARQHLKAFIGHHGAIANDAVAYEFGGGYDLAVPILLAQAGIKKQVVTDIAPLLKTTLVNDAIKRLGVNPPSTLSQMGIEYKTPVSTANTGFLNNSFDYIHSTDTLEHIPKVDILPILQECYRLLKPGGVISCIVDLQDHYAYFDSSLSKFNFYKYKKRIWERKYNNVLQYQNRLLADEYYSLFALAGFAPIQMQLTKAGDEETKRLKEIAQDNDFMGKPIEKLNNLRCHIVGEKPD